ncbi:MAG: hypothetical protein BA873_00470 [Desulfobulbaceae bacterium C00003063]|nr:MAG: hypothetical protein BA873_00470 [Desulfobulbaceae bacterium C00003063]
MAPHSRASHHQKARKGCFFLVAAVGSEADTLPPGLGGNAARPVFGDIKNLNGLSRPRRKFIPGPLQALFLLAFLSSYQDDKNGLCPALSPK